MKTGQRWVNCAFTSNRKALTEDLVFERALARDWGPGLKKQGNYDRVRPSMKCLFLFLLSFLVLPGLLPAADRRLVDRVTAVVNEEVITQSEFDTVFRPIYEQIKETYQGPELQKELREVRLKLLNQMIEDKLVYQEAEKMGIEVLDSEIEEWIASFKSQFPDEATFEGEMQRAGLTRPLLEEQCRQRLAIVRLHQFVIRGKVVVSPEEVEQYFQDHPDEFIAKDAVELWTITIRKSDEAIKEGITDEGAKKKAENLLLRLKRGADFSRLVMRNSQSSNAEAGGVLGFVTKGTLLDDIDRIIFSLAEGSFSDVLETERAYHIFKVGKKKIGVQKTFEELRDEIRDKVFRIKAHERFVEWMAEVKNRSYISVR